MFLDKFDEFIDYLNNNSIVNEWYMSDFAEKNIKTLDTYEAFNNLKLFVSYMIERYHPDFEYEIVETIKLILMSYFTVKNKKTESLNYIHKNTVNLF